MIKDIVLAKNSGNTVSLARSMEKVFLIIIYATIIVMIGLMALFWFSYMAAEVK